MKLTKKLEAEIKMLMDDYWDSYFRGDLKHWRNYLVNDYRNIGGTEEEIWNSKKEILDYTRRIINQMVGHAEIRNKKTQIIPYDPYIMVHEFMDLFIKVVGKWTFYGKFRLSSLIQKTDEEWKVLHQHGSYPDSHTEQGEAFAFDKLRKENKQLLEAVKRRTIELENKNRELEIETALEKVRTVALSMKKPEDMPEVCKTISLQLQSLGVEEIRNVQTAIFYETRGTYMNYEYYAKHKKTFITETVYTNHKVAKAFALKMLKGKGEIYTTHIKGKKVKEWLAYQKTTNVFIDRFLEKASSLNYYWHSLGPVALGISTYVPLNKDDLSLFNRFLNVFELAYTRYLDIEQAIAQAKEARIEASLERVRAQAMSMMKSDELLKVCESVFKELRLLGFNETDLRNTQIIINNDDKRIYSAYQYSDYIGSEIAEVPYDLHPVIRLLNDKLRQAKDAFADIEISGAALKDWKKFVNSFPQKNDAKLNAAKELHYYFYSVGIGALGISSFQSLPEEKLKILQRLRNVFNLSYQRYSDIALAEAQAKEAKIELSLERVRARAMAMQNSNELAELVTVVFKELTQLDFNITSSIIWINNPESLTNTLWVTSIEMNQPARPIHLTLFKHPFFHSIIHAWKVNDPKWIYLLTGREKSSFEKSFFKGAPDLPKALKSALAVPEKVVFSATFNNFGALELIGTEPLTDEKFEILHRFGKVFNSSYTRFNDLKLAEAQAREARIEAALEKVRSRSLAMHKSDELNEIVTILFEKLKELNIPVTAAGIGIYIDGSKDLNCYVCGENEEGLVINNYRLPYFHHKICEDFYYTREQQLDFYTGHYSKEEKNSFYKYVLELPELRFLPDDIKTMIMGSPAYTISMAPVKNAIFNLNDFEGKILSENEVDIIKRFAKVFDQSYTRFLDLQKAEAQAREAKIEAALERVRSRSLAMHSSGELGEVVTVVLNNLTELGYIIDQGAAAHLAIFSEGTKDFVQWSADPALPHSVRTFIPYTDLPILTEFWDARQKGHDFFAKVYSFDEKNTWFNFAFEHSDLKHIPGELKKLLLESETYAHSIAIEKNSAIIINSITGNQLSENQIDILRRFSKVFEQAYVRFLDLQKAEAQAREAKIEAALERTRTQSMLMQHSDELNDISKVFHQQLLDLHIETEFSYLWLPDEPNGKHLFWATWAEDENDETIYFSKAINYNLDKTEPATATCFADWESGVPVHVYTLTGDEMKAYFETWKELLSGAKKFKPEFFPEGIYYAEAFMKYGCFGIMIHRKITGEEQEILRRFTIEFERTYTRFLDLQKAEAQAREAQIEAALERVRSRSMAMQKSEELKEVIQVVYAQFVHLNILIEHTGFIMDYKARDDMHIWLADRHEVPSEVTIPYFDCAHWNSFNEAKEKERNFFANKLSFEEKNRFYQDLFKLIPGVPEETLEYYFSCPGLAISTVLLENVGLYIENFSGTPYSDEENATLMRFGKVFQQTYTRFLDLQKAEAQAREAQIEVALERIRAKVTTMQESSELLEIVVSMRSEFVALGHEAHYFWYMRWLPDKYEKAMTSGDGTRIGMVMELPRHIHGNIKLLADWEKSIEPAVVYAMDIEAAVDYVDKMIKLGDFKQVDHNAPTLDDIRHIGGLTFIMSRTIHGEIGYSLPGFVPNPPAEDVATLVRFAGVFDLAYQRFEDLKEAEKRNRETQIELALEKVRSRTMAMHQSDELGDVATVLFKELTQLVVNLWTCGFVLCEKDRTEDEWWLSDESGFIPAFYLPNTGDRVHENLYAGWKNEETYRTEQIEGAELDKHYEWLMDIPVTKKIFDDMATAGFQKPTWQKLHAAYFSKGYLCIITRVQCPEEEIFKRFAQVFDLTYTRFLDLQKSELQTHQAKIETALEKVRARALAMQQPEELTEVAQVMRHEMGLLGVEELETSSIYIHEENSDKAECWYAIKDIRLPEKKLVADHFALNLNDTWVGRQMITFYNSTKKQISIPMQGENRKEWIDYCSGQSKLLEGFYGNNIPDRTYHLYKFSNGTIGAATPGNISVESSELLQRAASVFSLAYSRFRDLTQARIDLQKLKEEKQRAETALTELQATQKQLIQSEKMASLGELTAGIAHEIQNPLNFVNNFSEVSTELVDEMNEEITIGNKQWAMGNMQEANTNLQNAMEIANDLKQNLEKINHHGKRAGDIVKGMLQHSRTSSGVMEPTNINALADEYLRLAYHGLRAKDKSFNSEMKTDFDESIEKINVIPQDIGRVILNLITNAFYAAAPPPPKGGISESERRDNPTVWVSTKKVGDKIFISVKDNGPGIPQKIIDKIFQPFFTTKPTGQGTGLGLSLSYDIVKAHGGEIKVETKEGEGSKFIIQLPVV